MTVHPWLLAFFSVAGMSASGPRCVPVERQRATTWLSPRRLASTITAQIDTLLHTRYKDFNDCHATEKLREVEGLRVSRELVRLRRRALGLPAKHHRRPRQYRYRRTPEARMGQLVQIAASPFAWLEARGPAMTLHGAIDDATGTVLALRGCWCVGLPLCPAPGRHIIHIPATASVQARNPL